MTHINTAGLYDLTEKQYHADPCEVPSLSRSTAFDLINETPRHVYFRHPRLGGKGEFKLKDKMALGNVAHALLLGKGAEYDVLEYDAYTTKASREARDASLEAGRTPIKKHEFAGAQDMANVAIAFINDCGVEIFQPTGLSEAVAVWQEGKTWCRAMMDWVNKGRTIIADYKTTGVSLTDENLSKLMVSQGYDMQAAMYIRGMEAINPDLCGRVKFSFLFQETQSPYLCRLVEPSGEMLALGRQKVQRAIDLWASCMERGYWPDYGNQITRISPPSWSMTQWEAQNYFIETQTAALNAA